MNPHQTLHTQKHHIDWYVRWGIQFIIRCIFIRVIQNIQLSQYNCPLCTEYNLHETNKTASVEN